MGKNIYRGRYFMETYDMLKQKFKNVKNQGYIKSQGKNKNSVGMTLENALGACGGDFNIPDFYDIEIKAVRGYYDAEFDLFNSAPDGKYINSTQWISENFGYPDRDYKNIKVFKGNIYGNSVKRIGMIYRFKLKVDRDEQKIYLEIYDLDYKIINEDIYWDFDTLKEKLVRKDSKLAIFWYCKRKINSEDYFYFYNMKFYKLISFEKFLDAIDKGVIFVTFKTGVNKSGPHIGKYTDHGTSFRISKENIRELFIDCT